MQPKYKRLLRELLESGKLNDWEQNTFEDIWNRDEQYGSTLSMKQKAMFDKAKAKYVDGEDTRNFKPEVPTEYDNCKLERTNAGYNILIEGKRISIPTTKSEGVIILAWLSEALPELRSNGHSEEYITNTEEPEEVNQEVDDNVPF